MMTFEAFFMMKAASSAEPCLTGLASTLVPAARRLAAEAAEDHGDEAAVHALAHDVGQDRARRADQRAGDDQREIAEREADARRRPAGIGIQHRHDHRHIGAADGTMISTPSAKLTSAISQNSSGFPWRRRR
jgi:hypothetical protein